MMGAHQIAIMVSVFLCYYSYCKRRFPPLRVGKSYSRLVCTKGRKVQKNKPQRRGNSAERSHSHETESSQAFQRIFSSFQNHSSYSSWSRSMDTTNKSPASTTTPCTMYTTNLGTAMTTFFVSCKCNFLRRTDSMLLAPND